MTLESLAANEVGKREVGVPYGGGGGVEEAWSGERVEMMGKERWGVGVGEERRRGREKEVIK